MAIKTRTKVHLYIRSSTGAFSGSDKLAELDSLSVTLNKNTFEFDFFDSTAINRVPDIRDATLNGSQILNPDDAIFARALTAYNSNSAEFVYVLAVFGDAPAGGAKNFAIQGRFLVTDFSPQPDLPGVLKVSMGFALETGSSLVVSTNVTSFPSAS